MGRDQPLLEYHWTDKIFKGVAGPATDWGIARMPAEMGVAEKLKWA